jgi:long-chain acyl-CoA synthetase
LSEHIRNYKTRTEFESGNWSKILQEKENIGIPETWMSFYLISSGLWRLIKIFYKVRNEGIENIPEGPFILASNHQSFLDGFILMGLLKWDKRKKTYAFAIKQYFPGIFIQFLARRNNIIFIDKDIKYTMKKSAELIKKGKNLVIFPEGARTRTGKLLDFKQTFAILSRELRVPVVPVGIEGAHEAWPRGKAVPVLFKKIKVNFSQPVVRISKPMKKFRRKL